MALCKQGPISFATAELITAKNVCTSSDWIKSTSRIKVSIGTLYVNAFWTISLTLAIIDEKQRQYHRIDEINFIYCDNTM